MTVTLDQLQRVVPAAFYRPNVAAHDQDIARWGGTTGVSRSRGDEPFFLSDAQIRVSSGGNRSGKTTKCSLEAGSNCIGYRPWYPPDDPRATYGIVRPHRMNRVRGLCVLSNFETKIPDIMAELEKWWPRELWEISAGTTKQPREIRWFTGATIRLISHKMLSRTDAEGIEADFIWYDEPPPPWLWGALNRGIVSTGGRIFIGATLLDSAGWFWESIIVPAESGEIEETEIFWHSIWDNCAENGGLETQVAKGVAAWLRQMELVEGLEVRLAREHGHPLFVGGRVLSALDRKTDIIDPFELPSDAWIYSAIDPGGAKPMAAAWAAVLEPPGEDPELHFFDESYDIRSRNDLELFADDFGQRDTGMGEILHPSSSIYTVMDPFANQDQKADKFGRNMTQILHEDYGIATVPADRQNKRARLASLNSRFRRKQAKVWRNCERLIYEAGKWAWDEDSPKLTTGADDVCDCCSYIENFDPVSAALALVDQEFHDVWLPERYRKKRKLGDESPLKRKYRLEAKRRREMRKEYARDQRIDAHVEAIEKRRIG